MRALDDAEEAEVRAKQLRERFGEQAEARCRAELLSFAPHDPRRRRAEDVFRALRWT
jgi:hypothetical protein